MVWLIELAPSAEKQLRKFDPKVAKRILDFCKGRLAVQADPRILGEALKVLSMEITGAIGSVIIELLPLFKIKRSVFLSLVLVTVSRYINNVQSNPVVSKSSHARCGGR